MYGVTTFDPLIDPPQSAILGVGAVRDHLALEGGQVTVRRLVDLALSFDHRILDGAEAALALKSIREQLESPLRLLM
jgi:2-oxoglutarate dehydrogenase E2 component (dihydrolipoamide succinyltransferase)